MGLPYLEVSHLASSTSFYSSILQPLGLCYLGTDRDHSSSVGTVTYGFPAHGRVEASPILQIREASQPFEPPKSSFIVFAASSPPAVGDFHDCALAANPWLRVPPDDGFVAADPRLRLGVEGGPTPGRATVRDLDSNTIQVVAAPPNAQKDVGQVLNWNFDINSRSKHVITRSQSHPLPSPTSSSASSHAHSQIAFHSQPRSQASNRSAHPGFGSTAPLAMPQRAPSQFAEEPEPFSEPSVSPRQSSSNNGLSTTTVVGALLGVAAGAAAGAALTYTFANNERDRRPRHEVDPPSLPRRSTFPQKAPSSHHQKPRHEDHGPVYTGYPPKALPYRSAGAYEQHTLPPPLSYPEEMPFQQTTYPDNYPPRALTYPEEFTPKKLSYPDDYIPRKMPYDDEDEDSDEAPPRRRSGPSLHLLSEDNLHNSSRSTAAKSTTRSIAKSTAKSTSGRTTTAKSTTRSTARSTTKSVARSIAKSRGPDEIEEIRSRHSSRHSRASGRSRSEAPAPRVETAETVIEHRSHVGSRHSVAARSTHSPPQPQRRHHDPERDSYYSARSRRSSTARHPPPPEVETEIMEAPEVPEVPEVPTYDDYEDYHHVPRGPELMIRRRDGSKVSARRLSNGIEPPIHMSHVGRAPSHVSARHVALPMSGVGSSQADWDDDDIISLAPSDSISCVGSKTSRRSRRVK
ncbi:hypothetical protein BGZ63DRAFT_421007 [Mariannaea sp. PMI_226]|nr:hypothetical protein BGZ63DRAFT_421007 [Mariannaea sp. PMI_226]